ncbi:nicotinamidase-related amidase [Paenibacillus sp. RC254]
MDKYTNPNFTRCAVITIDTQNDFSLPGAIAEIKGTHEVIPRVKTILEVLQNESGSNCTCYSFV